MTRKSTPPLSALLFDVDGTLADTERDGHRIAFNAAFAEHGLDWHWDVARYGELLSITGGKERIRHFVSNYLPDYVPPQDFDDLVITLHRSKTAHYARLLEQGNIPLRPGVTRLLQEARDAGLRLAIATTTTPENVTALLRCSLAEDAENWLRSSQQATSYPTRNLHRIFTIGPCSDSTLPPPTAWRLKIQKTACVPVWQQNCPHW